MTKPRVTVGNQCPKCGEGDLFVFSATTNYDNDVTTVRVQCDTCIEVDNYYNLEGDVR